MAITDLGNLGTGSATSAGTTITITNTTGGPIPAGTLIHITGTWDNINSVTAPTITSSTVGGAAPTANHATAIGQGVTTTAGSGVWHQCFRVVTTSIISTGATIATLTSNQSAVKRAACTQGFSGATATLRGTVTTAVNASGAASVTSTGTALVATDLVIGSVSGETNAVPTGDSDTTNGSWTAITGTATSGGAANTNVATGTQAKVVNATGAQTYNLTTANDCVACIYSVQAIPEPAVTQAAYRFYADGTETGSTALGTQDTAYTADLSSDITTVLDSYSTANADTQVNLTGTNLGYAQSFIGNGQRLDTAGFYMMKQGTPVGTITSVLYAHSGTFGASGSEPTGAALATSTGIAATSFPTSNTMVYFQFDKTFTLVDGTAYFIAVETTVDALDSPNTVQGGVDASSATHAGWRSAKAYLNSWANPSSLGDAVFEVSTVTNDLNLQLRARLQETAGSSLLASTDDWQLQWEKTSGAGTLLVDQSAANSNNSSFWTGATFKAIGQSFLGNGGNLSQAGFMMHKFGAPAGDLRAELYAHTGTFGSTGVATGSPLATSTTLVSAAALGTSVATEFTAFDFDQSFTLVNGTPYVIVLTSVADVGASFSDAVQVRSNGTSVISGNLSGRNQAGTWAATGTHDLTVQVYTTSGTWTNVVAGATESLVDSYPVGNQDGTSAITTTNRSWGQSFLGDGRNLTRATFYLLRTGTTDGTIVAELYAHTGNFGTDGVPTGSPLATSTTALDASTLTTSSVQYSWDFASTVTLANGTPYCIVLTRQSPTTGTVGLGIDSSAPTHAGIQCTFSAGDWIEQAADVIFEVYGIATTVVPYASANLTDAAATTNRLGAGSGSFVAGKVSEDGLVDDLAWTASNYTEVLYSVTLKEADLADADTLRFRVLRNAATTGMTYTQVPTINVTITAGTDFLGTATLTGSGSLSTTAVPAVTGATAALSGAGTLSTTAFVAFGVSATNLVKNPSFEVNLDGWNTGFWVGTETRVGTGAQSGSWAMRHTGLNVAANTTVIINDEAPLIPVSPNTVYNWSCYASGNRPDAKTVVLWYNSSSVNVGTGTFGNTVTLTGTPQRSSATGTSPGTAAFAAIGVAHTTADSNTAHYVEVDAFQLTAGATLHSYFDGDSAGAFWNGTAHASTSTRVVGGGVAAFTGSGTLGAVGVLGGLAFSGSATLSGDGTLTTVQVPRPTQVATLSGAGTLSTVQVPRPVVAASLSGTGTLSTVQVPRPTQTATLTGAGTLSTTQAPRPTQTAVLAGDGSLAATGVADFGAAIATITSQLFIGGVPVGSPVTHTLSTDTANVYAEFTVPGLTRTQLQSGTLTVRHVVTHANNTTPATVWVDSIELLADYQTTLPSTEFVGTATLTGTGTLTTTIVITAVATVPLSGSGSLSSTGAPGPAAAAVLSGSGTLTAVTVPRPTAAAALSGSGTLSAVGAVTVTGATATLTGSGTLTTTAAPAVTGATATLTGSGTLSAVGAPAPAVAVTLAGTGTLSAVGVAFAAAAGTATLTGTGTLSTTGLPKLAVTVTLSGSGALSAVGVPRLVTTVTLSGTGTLSTTQVVRPTGVATLTGTGVLSTVQTFIVVAGSATLSGDGVLVAFGVPTGTEAGSVDLIAVPIFTVTGVREQLATVALVSTSNLTVAGTRAVAAAAALSAVSTLSVTATPTVIASAALSATSNLTAVGVTAREALADLAASSNLSVTATPVAVASAALASTSNLTVAGVRAVAATAALTSTSNLSADGRRQPEAAAALTAVSTLTTTGAVVVVAAAALSATSNLSTTAQRVLEGVAALTATSNLTADGTAAREATVPLTAVAYLSVTAVATAHASVDLTASSNLVASETPVAVAAAHLASTSNLTVAAAVTVVASAALASTSNLTVAGLVTQPATVALTSTSNLTVAGIVTQPASAALVATSNLTTVGEITAVTAEASAALVAVSDLVVPTYVTAEASVALVAVSDLSVVGTLGQPVSVDLSATSDLTVPTYVVAEAAAALTATSDLTVVGTRDQYATVALTATSNLTTVGARELPGAVALVAVSNLLATGTTEIGIDDLEDFEGAADGIATTEFTTLFNSVQNAGPGITHSEMRSITGIRSARIIGQTTVLQLRRDVTLRPTSYIRVYAYIGNAPDLATGILTLDRVSSTARARVVLQPDRTLTLRNGVTTIVGTSPVIPAGQWVRLEWRGTNNVNQELRIYTGVNLHTTTATSTITGAYNTGDHDRIMIGSSAAGAGVGFEIFYDTLATSRTIWPGPVPLFNVSAPLAAVSNLTTTGFVVRQAAATIRAVSNLLFTAIRGQFGVAPLTAVSNLTATGLRTQLATVALSASSHLSVDGTRQPEAAVALTATSHLSADGRRQPEAAAALAASSNLTVAETVTAEAAAALVATSNLSTVGTPTYFAAADLTAASNLTVTARPVVVSSAALTSVSTFTAFGIRVPTAGVALDAVSDLAVTVFAVRFVAVTLNASSVLSTVGVRTQLASAAIMAQSLLLVTAQRVLPGVADLHTVSDFTAEGLRTPTASIVLEAYAELAVAALRTGMVSVDLFAESDMGIGAEAGVALGFVGVGVPL